MLFPTILIFNDRLKCRFANSINKHYMHQLQVKVSKDKIIGIPQLASNPLKDRIVSSNNESLNSIYNFLLDNYFRNWIFLLSTSSILWARNKKGGGIACQRTVMFDFVSHSLPFPFFHLIYAWREGVAKENITFTRSLLHLVCSTQAQYLFLGIPAVYIALWFANKFIKLFFLKQKTKVQKETETRRQSNVRPFYTSYTPFEQPPRTTQLLTVPLSSHILEISKAERSDEYFYVFNSICTYSPVGEKKLQWMQVVELTTITTQVISWCALCQPNTSFISVEAIVQIENKPESAPKLIYHIDKLCGKLIKVYIYNCKTEHFLKCIFHSR